MYGNQLQFNCPLYMPSREAMFIHSVCLFVRFYLPHLLAVHFYRAIIKQQKQRLGSPPSNWIWKYGYRVSVSIRFPTCSRSPPKVLQFCDSALSLSLIFMCSFTANRATWPVSADSWVTTQVAKTNCLYPSIYFYNELGKYMFSLFIILNFY